MVASEHRRLAAIVVADVVGYSRMMADDEDGTLAALRAHLRGIEPVILNHGGRVVKTTGDGMLLEFPSATAALEAAIEMQELMRERNDDIPEARRMVFRIGINLGDVIVDEDGDVFGDGVNVAARVESLADPAGVAVTGAVHEAVRGKVDVEFTDDGEHQLKNIPRRVRIWKVGAGAAPAHQTVSTRPRTLATVAVLPFDNMSGEPNQEYFADGITEDLLTALARDKNLAVISRNSTFAYKGAATDVRTIARELDATHIVEGSVRRAGNRVRVTAQLIDAESGHHVFAERYDRELADIFEVQDELVDALVSRLRPSFLEAAGRHREGDSPSIDAWDLTIRGMFELNKRTIDGYLAAIDFFGRAHQLDGDLATPVAGSAEAWWYLAFWGWRDPGVNPWQRALEAAEAAYALDRDDYMALGALAGARVVTGRLEEAARTARRMIDVNPHDPRGYHMAGVSLSSAGNRDEAIPLQAEAWRLGEHQPWRHDTGTDLAFSHYLESNYEAALRWGLRSQSLVDDYLQVHLILAATYAQLQRTDEGNRHVEFVLAARPDFSCAKFRSRLLFVLDDDRDHIVEGLMKAGLPE